VTEGKVTDLCEGLGFDQRIVELYRQSAEIVDGMDIMHIRGRRSFEFLYCENLLDLAEAFLGPEITCNPIQHYRAKMPHAVDPDAGFMNVPWHQDVGVTIEESDASTIYTFWIPIVDATVETGCMQLMPGGERLGVLPHFAGPYGPQIEDDAMPPVEPVDAECSRGGVVVMDKYTPHRGQPNESTIARWSVDLRYQVTGHHSGRPTHPDFPVRSRAHPAIVRRDYDWWWDAWEQALNNEEGVRFHRV